MITPFAIKSLACALVLPLAPSGGKILLCRPFLLSYSTIIEHTHFMYKLAIQHWLEMPGHQKRHCSLPGIPQGGNE